VTSRRALFVQATEPGAYPPVINAALLLAEDGWEVTILGAPIEGTRLLMPSHPRVRLEAIAVRTTHVMTKGAYAAYCLRTVSLARDVRPSLVYASDPLSALPGLLAARLAGSRPRLIYHEHDSPNAQADLNALVRVCRRRIMAASGRVIFPNAARAAAIAEDLDFDQGNLAIVWNVPRRGEIVSAPRRDGARAVVYYHGSINPVLLPPAAAAACASLRSKVILRIVGYETGEGGYVARLERDFGKATEGGLIDYRGQIPRDKLLQEAAKADIGLAALPMDSTNLNLQALAGASNKVFDYMAASLPVIVSELPDWRAMFVDEGHALAADPRDATSLAAAIGRLVDDPALRTAMGEANRRKIARDWNYDTQFAPILSFANGAAG
jgi:glycosyltransferase involved in cell wall biosynthesis